MSNGEGRRGDRHEVKITKFSSVLSLPYESTSPPSSSLKTQHNKTQNQRPEKLGVKVDFMFKVPKAA